MNENAVRPTVFSLFPFLNIVIYDDDKPQKYAFKAYRCV